MPFFQTNKNKFLESKIGEAYDTLDNPFVSQRLGAYAEDLRTTLGDLYIPNIRQGRVAPTPASLVDTDATPIILHERRRAIDISSSNADFSITQRENISEELRILGLMETDNECHGQHTQPRSDEIVTADYWDAFSKTEQFTSRRLPDRLAAAVIRCFVAIPATFNSKDYQASVLAPTRPAVILRYMRNIPLDLLPHELVHVRQAHSTGLLTFDEIKDPLAKLSRELEAYHVGSCIALGLNDDRGGSRHIPRRSASDLAIEVESVRLKFATEGQPFVANEAIVSELYRMNLSGIYYDESLFD